MKNYTLKCIGLFLWLIVNLELPVNAQLSVDSDRLDSSYETGETVNFLIQGPAQAEVEYSLFFDRFTEPLINGSINLDGEGSGVIPFTFDEPGVIFCEVDINGQKTLESVQVSFEEIEPFEEEPADWDIFWASQVAELQEIPLDPQLTLLETTTYYTTYRINLANIDNRRVYGYITVPVGDGPFPAILSLPSYGAAPGLTNPQWSIAERGGAISVAVGIHNVEPDQEDPNAYMPNEITDREGYYYRYAILGTIRMIDYLFTRPDFDGQNIGLTGVSQGGGLSILIAGIDERVNLLAVSKNILGEHAAHKYGRASGFPNYLKYSRDIDGSLEHENATLAASKYYDAVYAARRYEGPVFMTVGYQDIISPAATSMACYNQFKGPKILFHETNFNHSQNSEEFTNGRYAFFRRYFSSMQSPPWPWPETTLGYGINAGGPYMGAALSPLLLNGSITLEQNQNPSDFQPKWTLLEGPGTATFANTQSYSTEVVFSTPGVYRLQFSGTDKGLLEGAQKYYTLADEVEVVVEESVSTAVEKESNHSLIKLTPNPANDYVKISGMEGCISGMVMFELFDSRGSLLLNKRIQATHNLTIDLSHLPSGIYFVHLSAQRSDRRIIKKLMVK